MGNQFSVLGGLQARGNIPTKDELILEVLPWVSRAPTTSSPTDATGSYDLDSCRLLLQKLVKEKVVCHHVGSPIPGERTRGTPEPGVHAPMDLRSHPRLWVHRSLSHGDCGGGYTA